MSMALQDTKKFWKVIFMKIIGIGVRSISFDIALRLEFMNDKSTLVQAMF